MVQDHNLPVPADDGRRLEVVVDCLSFLERATSGGLISAYQWDGQAWTSECRWCCPGSVEAAKQPNCRELVTPCLGTFRCAGE